MSKYEKNEKSEEMAQTLEEQREKRFNRVRWRFRITVVILLIAVIIPLSVREGMFGPTVLEPDYALVPDEGNARPSGDNYEKLETKANGGAVAMIYSDEVNYELAADVLHLSYTNPSNSTAAVILQIIITNDGDEFLLAESGALRPGFTLETLDSDKAANVALAEGVYNGVMRVRYYNPESGERALVHSDIEIKITVQ